VNSLSVGLFNLVFEIGDVYFFINLLRFLASKSGILDEALSEVVDHVLGRVDHVPVNHDHLRPGGHPVRRASRLIQEGVAFEDSALNFRQTHFLVIH